MGRKTWESLPFKPLPKRRNIVLSSQSVDGVESYHSIDECLQNISNESDVFVIGGAQIYKAFYPLAHQLHITQIDLKTEDIDTFFPISIEKIKNQFSISLSEKLTDNATYTHWIKS